MKRFFLATLLVLGCSAAFMACDNGQYDADPETNNSGVTNPLNPPDTGQQRLAPGGSYQPELIGGAQAQQQDKTQEHAIEAR